MRRLLPVAAAICCSVAGCAGREVLETHGADAPAGLDLSGFWQLRDNGEDTGRRNAETLVRVFLEDGRRLKITQTEHGLFISFDRAVVEEYRFGEHREISVGAVTADRVSGWEGRAYVIETLDEKGAKLVETWRLAADGNTLERSIVIGRRDRRDFERRQTFERR